MDKVQNGAKNDKALDELCKRYESRGLNSAKEGKTIPPEQKLSNTQRILSGGEFVDYYNNYRDYTPEPNVQFDSTVVLQKIEREDFGNVARKGAGNRDQARAEIKSQLARDARAARSSVGATTVVYENGAEKKITKTENGYLIREKKNGVIGYTEQKPKPTAKETIKKASEEWIPLEERKKEKCIEGKKSKIPTMTILAIITIFLALMLIVGSAVMVSSARSEQNRLLDEIATLQANEKLLSEELDKKNRDADIALFAEEELGMISQDYVSVKYIKSDKEDSLSVYKEENESYWSSVIKSIFPFLN